VDHNLFSLINSSHAPWLDDLMLLATEIGRAGFVWLVIAAIAAVFPQHRMAAWRVALAVGLAYLVVDGVLKPLIDRARPFEVVEAVRVITTRPLTSSFPSGHAASAFAGALATSRLFPGARPILWPLAVLIAISRIYVGVHWPSDVLAGALIGFAVGWFALGGRQVGRSRSLQARASVSANR
jgi:undecaprenyl-diphosphatase